VLERDIVVFDGRGHTVAQRLPEERIGDQVTQFSSLPDRFARASKRPAVDHSHQDEQVTVTVWKISSKRSARRSGARLRRANSAPVAPRLVISDGFSSSFPTWAAKSAGCAASVIQPAPCAVVDDPRDCGLQWDGRDRRTPAAMEFMTFEGTLTLPAGRTVATASGQLNHANG
jgi:hypothetical protein